MSKNKTIQNADFDGQMIKSYINTLALNTQKEPTTEITNLVENPWWDKKDNDPISMIFHRFYKFTTIHPTLPIFAFISLVSAWCVKEKVSYEIPGDSSQKELDIWVLLLSKTGACKTLAEKIMRNCVPRDIHDNPTIEPNICQPASNAGLIAQLEKLPDARGFWKQDEASQFLKQVDTNSGPLAGIKQTILFLHDHDDITYSVKSGNTVIKNPVITVLFINTIELMRKALEGDSIVDGTFRRFVVAMAADDPSVKLKSQGEHPLFDLNKISDESFEKCIEDVFMQNISNAKYTFDKDCKKLYSTAFTACWDRQYSTFLHGTLLETYYRTYMMESWKYAIFHHIMTKQSGFVVSPKSLQWGIRVSIFLLNGLQMFVKSKIKQEQVDKQIKTFDKIKLYIQKNEHKKGFGCRSVLRSLHIKKDELMENLDLLRKADKNFKTKLFSDLESWKINKKNSN